MTVTKNKPDVSPAALALPSAPLWKRLFAIVYDAFLLFAIAMMCSFVYVVIKGSLVGFEQLKTMKTGHFGGLPLFVLILVGWYLFFYWFWTRNGQTLGMQAWRLRVQQIDGRNITARQAAIRLSVAILSWLCGGIGYLWCLLPDAIGRKRCWHDMASGTEMVVLPKP